MGFLGDIISIECQRIVNYKLNNSHNFNDWVDIPVTMTAMNFIHIFTMYTEYTHSLLILIIHVESKHNFFENLSEDV